MKSLARPALVFGLALFYGLVTRVLFTYEPLRAALEVVSWSYIFLMPIGFGALTTFLGFRLCGRSRFWIYGAPLLVTFIGLICSAITRLEAVICVVVAAPVMLPFALIGGILMGWILSRGSGRLQISILVLLPFAASPLEQLWQQPQEIVSITDSVDIRASPEIVWNNIASVRPISREEIPFQLIYLIGFPRPISAEIDAFKVGARRHATFERGVAFYETVTNWEPPRTLSFTIKADPKFIPHTAFDQHIIVGGRFYDVLDGTYVIHKTATGSQLVLTSSHRLATPFNFYAGLWSEWVMNQIQGSILTVIKHRAEVSGERDVASLRSE